MRLDYYHTGNAKAEMFSVDRIVVEPLPWPGDLKRAIDETNLGKYFFEVKDKASGRLLYSRGFASIYGEWETTDEAKTANRTFNESLRFPMPEAPVEIVLKKRDPQNEFMNIWTTVVDPKDMFVDNSKPASPGPLLAIEKNGDSRNKVDFLILGDGYTASQKGKCEKDARRLAEIMFGTEPFKQRRKDFNVWALCPAAAERGISRPSTGVHKRSPAGSSYDAFGSERYVLTTDNHAFRDLASFAPNEFVEILVNNNTYGGGGIFGQYGTVAADSLWAPYVFVHEFGHHFAALADEYYTSDVAMRSPEKLIEPWEPNVTALLNPALLKWKDLVEPGTPLPTPWNKEAFETYSHQVQNTRRQIRKDNRPESEMDALFHKEREDEERMLGAEKYAQKVGAFEGANYEPKGYYRPQTNCIMFTRTEHFCRVCQRAIERVIDLYSR
ncbi:MAG TPA: IgA Peptidase M64 [Clostridia bacterium]|nr:IgA Peptidase M64 [Clostridia bacterium]